MQPKEARMKFWIQSYVKANDTERDGAPTVAYSMEEAEAIAKEEKKTHERVIITDDYDDLGGRKVLKVL
jgi:hypothetical protein